MFVRILLLLVITILLIVKTKKNIHILQQNLYNENNRYFRWYMNHESNFFTVELLLLVLVAIVDSFLSTKEGLAFVGNVILLILYIFYILSYYKKIKQEPVKKPLVITARVKRLLFTTIILYAIPLILFVIYHREVMVYSFLVFVYAMLCYFNGFILLIANFINKHTVEKFVYYYYHHKAVSKLKNMSNLKVIGITGSYGKTSSKNILADILNVKYVTLASPKNLNTPYGLMITVNNYLDKFNDIFIAEMGAYRPGEIKQLCDFVKPKYGILTRIGTAHLETFGSQKNIQKTKFELIESLPLDGVGILNKDDPNQTSYELKNTCKILWIGIEQADVDVHASDICCTNQGTKFTVTFKGDKKKYPFETKLLGDHNVYNILAAIALGRELGISISQLQQAVKGVKPIEHRLELKRLGNFYQIDDAYNSNPVGAKKALEVLAMMPGLKIVVTPGMIELGAKENELNEKFGEQIAECSKADYVILIGEKQTKPIQKGLMNKHYDMDRVIVYNNVVDAYTFIRGMTGKEDVYALFENDLPDTYNEK